MQKTLTTNNFIFKIINKSGANSPLSNRGNYTYVEIFYLNKKLHFVTF